MIKIFFCDFYYWKSYLLMIVKFDSILSSDILKINQNPVMYIRSIRVLASTCRVYHYVLLILSFDATKLQ